MIDRKELKERAKAAFKANYWRSVIVSFILSALVGGSTAASSSKTTESANQAAGTENVQDLSNAIKENPKVFAVIIGVIITIVLVVFLVCTIIDAFVTNPAEVGCRSFFLRSSDDANTNVEEVKTGFVPNYMRNVKAMFLKDLYVGLWALLLIVPGVIKSYAYQLVPYILAENPDIAPKDALKLSEDMMNGHKKEAFLLDLSFIPWDILSVVTLGIGQIFYAGPYMRAADAEFYKAVKESYNA